MLTRASLMAFIPVRDLASARAFYGSTLGLSVTGENPFAVVLDANGTMLRLTPVPDLQPQPFTIAGWEVADIGATVDALASVGITFLRFEGMEQAWSRMRRGSGRPPAVTSSPGSPTPMAIPCP